MKEPAPQLLAQHGGPSLVVIPGEQIAAIQAEGALDALGTARRVEQPLECDGIDPAHIAIEGHESVCHYDRIGCSSLRRRCNATLKAALLASASSPGHSALINLRSRMLATPRETSALSKQSTLRGA